MRFIKTYWHNIEGKIDQEYLLPLQRERLYQFSLSSLMLVEHHEVDLYTDQEGESVVKQLNIPFKNIFVVETRSSRYVSLNDLYVLSMQDEPLCLIGDDILAKGKIIITPKKGQITVLKTYLNSFILVQAIMKVTRISPDIPFFNDELWHNKMAYVDASLLVFSIDNTLIKNYVAEAEKFVAIHLNELSKIDSIIIDRFIKVYWLYSFFTLKGIPYDTFFVDPFSIKLHYEKFDFTKKNTIQNIFQKVDNNRNSSNFSKQFFKLFKHRYPATLNLIETGIEKNTRLIRDNIPPFVRTEQAIFKLNAADADRQNLKSRKLKIIEIKQIIAKYEDKTPKTYSSELVSDAFTYEQHLKWVNKYYLKNKRDILSQELKSFQFLLDYWDVVPERFDELNLKINPFVFLCESKWKWCTSWVHGVSYQKVAELKVMDNMLIKPTYFITAFSPNIESELTHEFSIDKGFYEILDFFNERSSINNFLYNVTFDNPAIGDEEGLYTKNRQKYYDKIKELLQINMLSIDE